jgi:hypothetical protein
VSCFQCDLDIPHVCYAGMPNARWGMGDEALAALEAAQRYLNAPHTGRGVGVKLKKKVNDVKATDSIATGLRIPEGWTFEPLPRLPDQLLLNTPPPQRYMTTIDFRARGYRSGYSTTGRFVGEEWNKRRKKYIGHGWRQALVDDAVAHLQEVLR